MSVAKPVVAVHAPIGSVDALMVVHQTVITEMSVAVIALSARCLASHHLFALLHAVGVLLHTSLLCS
jgi:hypothetical protein